MVSLLLGHTVATYHSPRLSVSLMGRTSRRLDAYFSSSSRRYGLLLFCYYAGGMLDDKDNTAVKYHREKSTDSGCTADVTPTYVSPNSKYKFSSHIQDWWLFLKLLILCHLQLTLKFDQYNIVHNCCSTGKTKPPVRRVLKQTCPNRRAQILTQHYPCIRTHLI